MVLILTIIGTAAPLLFALIENHTFVHADLSTLKV